MSKHLYEAAILQLRGRALAAYATLELLFKNPAGMPDHSAWAEEIIKHTKILAENENAMITLQQHFGKHFNPQQPPAPVPTGAVPPQPIEEPLAMTPEKSPLVRRELQRQKMVEAAKARQARPPQKELYPSTEEESGLKESTTDEPKLKRTTKKSRQKNE